MVTDLKTEEYVTVSEDPNRSCPKCEAVTIKASYDSHPTAVCLRELALWSTLIGFVGFLVVCFLGAEPGGRVFGYNMFGFALAPGAFLLTISLLYPKVWNITCAKCRIIFYRIDLSNEWKYRKLG